MTDMGSYIWFIGLGACLVALAAALAVGRLRASTRIQGNPNHAWEQAAWGSGHPRWRAPKTRLAALRLTKETVRRGSQPDCWVERSRWTAIDPHIPTEQCYG